MVGLICGLKRGRSVAGAEGIREDDLGEGCSGKGWGEMTERERRDSSALSEGLWFVYAEGRGDIVREIEACVFWRWGRMDRLWGCPVGMKGVAALLFFFWQRGSEIGRAHV